MTAPATIPYATPLRRAKPHTRIGMAAFALGAFAAGAMLLCLLAVSFPLMNAPASWEVMAAVFGFTMLGSWVLSMVLTLVAMFQRETSRTYPRMAFVMDLLAVFFAVMFLGAA